MDSIDASALILAETSRALPQPALDLIVKRIRADRYGGLFVANPVPPKQLLADEGSYFVTTNPTPSTKIDYGSAGTQATFSDTVPFMMFFNAWTATDLKAKRCYFDILRLIQIGGTAPASTTSVQAAIKTDTINRLNTAGVMTLLTPVNANTDDGTPSRLQVYVPAGAVATIPAAGPGARLIDRLMLKGGPTLLLDEYNIVFGAQDTPTQGGYLTTVASYISAASPVVLGPQEWCILHLWLLGGATNAFSFEFSFKHWER